ncbi:MAG: response regulator [Sandaracinaceae bacterium]|nr:response regulator [Sandaracinaceae bacterium]
MDVLTEALRKRTAMSDEKPRLLVIDDEPMMGTTLDLLLSDEYEVHYCPSVREALDRLGTDRDFHAILCDLMMPGQSGMDFDAALEAIAPSLRDRLVFMSGGVYTANARAFVNESNRRLVSKPFDLDVLLGTLRSIGAESADSI